MQAEELARRSGPQREAEEPRPLQRREGRLPALGVRRDSHQTWMLLNYAARPDGQRACIAALKAHVERHPLRLRPESFSPVQELLGHLMLGAMLRGDFADQRTLVTVSHGIVLIVDDAGKGGLLGEILSGKRHG